MPPYQLVFLTKLLLELTGVLFQNKLWFIIVNQQPIDGTESENWAEIPRTKKEAVFTFSEGRTFRFDEQCP